MRDFKHTVSLKTRYEWEIETPCSPSDLYDVAQQALLKAAAQGVYVDCTDWLSVTVADDLIILSFEVDSRG